MTPASSPRAELRRALRERRQQFALSADHAAAEAALAGHLTQVITQLEPQCLGLYASIRSEFNAVVALAADPFCDQLPWALPFCRREPREMDYRQWDRHATMVPDECGIASAAGPVVVPDVVLVPCVGYAAGSYRLGYGGGYFDRFLARHPHVTTVGVARSFTELGPDQFSAQPHDIPLTLIVTERGVAA
ncbi:5-formyltetrahydrofolate cyclo-ligase [Piscinibacter aquaticus]|uniref:5-formyltetrahydrofolate cyclo-ligase n=1 Tax=Piscinibacter aquaticus TaxID=392597 RepID=A0A5C6U4Z8_9BURK|nr:5-formyltetrahydrofolate cyclo-ligase [Piscinibacter aquaticus]